MLDSVFKLTSRQKFRRHYQPTRILLACVPDPTKTSGTNVITLCFSSYVSYKPPMVAFSIQKPFWTNKLMKENRFVSLCVPGESLAAAALKCGTWSGQKVDKIEKLGLRTLRNEIGNISVLEASIGRLDCEKVFEAETGDHTTFVVQVRAFVARENHGGSCLLSIGPDTTGYRLLAHHGIHRIAVVDGPTKAVQRPEEPFGAAPDVQT